MSISAQQVKSEIEQAFRGVPRPLANAIGFDLAHLGAIEVSQWLAGKSWTELALDDLIDKGESLYLLSDEAYCYFLPAYLCAVLESFEQHIDCNLEDQVLGTLRPPEMDSEKTDFISRMEHLTTPQKNAIKTFLEYAAVLHDEAIVMLKASVEEHLRRGFDDLQLNPPLQLLSEYWGKV